MNIKQERVIFAGEQWILTNQRALFWERQQMLILSDLHLGKAAHFRNNGIGLPMQLSIDDLQRLEDLILFFDVRTVLVVGDLIHAGANKEVALLGEFTARFPHISFVLIKGNHDRISAALCSTLGISAVYNTLEIEGVCFVHHPDERHSDQYTVSGHLHPGVAVRMPTKRIMQFPCFALGERQLILPAFSKFTGTDTRSLPRPSRCYAFYDAGIFEVDLK